TRVRPYDAPPPRARGCGAGIPRVQPGCQSRDAENRAMRTASRRLVVLLAGDVMTGRGVDQILKHPGAPELHEPAVRDARAYVELAEAKSGPIPRHVDDAYVWGDALETLGRIPADARIVNLETSITRRDTAWPGK